MAGRMRALARAAEISQPDGLQRHVAQLANSRWSPVNDLANVFTHAKLGIGWSTRFTRWQEQELGAADGGGL